jgi:endonuclease-3
MKTSRIAKETAKIVNQIPRSDFTPRRQTRSFAASLHALTTKDLPLKQKKEEDVKQEDSSDDGSSLSSIASAEAFDIEDVPFKTSPSRKRKRGLDTAATSVSTVTTTRSSPHKPGLKVEDGSTKSGKKARRQHAKSTINTAGEVEIHPPANWEEIYDAVREMRKLHLAPVDTMGCETLAEENLTPRVRLQPPNPTKPTNKIKDKRFQTLIALMLSKFIF